MPPSGCECTSSDLADAVRSDKAQQVITCQRGGGAHHRFVFATLLNQSARWVAMCGDHIAMTCEPHWHECFCTHRTVQHKAT